MTKQADLIAYLFEGQRHALSGTLMQWIDASPRFTSFVETYRDKIRKKVRVTREPQSILDLRAELEVAYCLLNDRRLTVAYEPYASAKGRGADFAVTYRANLVFNVEVARMHADKSAADGAELRRSEERIVRILLDKLGQMQPGMANVLAIYVGEDVARSVDLAEVMQELKARVEGKDAVFYAARGYAGPAAFYKDFLRLSGIVLWGQAAQVWENKQARPGLDPKVLRLVGALPGSGCAAPRK